MNTTFDQIYQAELRRTGSPARAYSRAVVVHGFLVALAQPSGNPDRSPSRDERVSGSFYRHKTALRRAGIAPITDPRHLSALARDLGVTEVEAIGRLLWVLNADRRTPTEQKRSRAAFASAHQAFIDEAQSALLGQAEPAPIGGSA